MILQWLVILKLIAVADLNDYCETFFLTFT